jgi:hypothetical protein
MGTPQERLTARDETARPCYRARSTNFFFGGVFRAHVLKDAAVKGGHSADTCRAAKSRLLKAREWLRVRSRTRKPRYPYWQIDVNCKVTHPPIGKRRCSRNCEIAIRIHQRLSTSQDVDQPIGLDLPFSKVRLSKFLLSLSCEEAWNRLICAGGFVLA